MPYSKQTWADSPATTSPISAARLGHIEDGIFTAQSTADTATVYYDITADGSVKADGVTDDTAAINAAIAASPIGCTVWFPVGTYLISGPIILYPSREYVGAGHALAGPSCANIKLKTGANPTAAGGVTGMLVAQGWSTNAAHCDYPMRVRNLALDGNRTGNPTSHACGIVLCNFWTWIEDCYIVETSAGGILLTDTGANGTTVIDNTASENRIINTKITGIGGDGVRLVSNNSNSNLDGFLDSCLISYTSGYGVNFDRSAGWTLRRNHFYGIGDSAMWLGNTFATSVEHNYIEDFGGNNTAGTYYNGIGFNQLDGRGSTVIGNFVGTSEPSTNTSYYYFISANAGSYETDAQVVIAGNICSGGDGANGYGVSVSHGSNGAHMNADIAGNHIAHITHPYALDAADNTTGVPPAATTALDHGYLSWSFDPSLVQGSTAATGGVLNLVKVRVPYDMSITNIVMYVGTAGATLTANQCYAALYTSGGALLAKTAQQATNWTSTGLKVMALATTQKIPAGYAYVAFYSTGTTQPAFARSGTLAVNNAGLSAGGYRYATANTALTTTIPTTLGTQTASANSYWVALS